ncbi:MAG: hypothetical protein ABR540_22975 [Acidimicrobiales bacterium]
MKRILTLTVIAMFAAAACGGGDEEATATSSPARQTTVPPSATATTATTATTAAMAPVATTQPPTTSPDEPPPRFSGPGETAAYLYNAWRAGDRQDAAAAAVPAAVDVLFSRAWRTPGFEGSECQLRQLMIFDCFFQNQEEALVMQVEGGASVGYQVTGVRFRPLPIVSPAPSRGPVGTQVRIEGQGFVGDPWQAADPTLWLAGNVGTCNLYAAAEHTVRVDGEGRLAGEFTVPATADCRMDPDGRQFPVQPGSYQIVFSCTACVIGTFEVTP